MNCPSCGRENPDGAKFCRYCGASMSAAPQTPPQSTYVNAAPQTQQETFVNASPQSQQGTYVNAAPQQAPKKEKKKLFKKKEKPAAAQSASESRAPSQEKITVDKALLITFLLLELVPYILRSLVMAATKTVMPVPVYMICGILGWCAAGGALIVMSRLITGISRLPYVLSFLGLIAVSRLSEAILLPHTNTAFVSETAVFYIAMLVIQLLADILMLAPLGRIFSVKGEVKQGGKLTAFLFVVIAMNLDTVMNILWTFTLAGVGASFVGACAYRAVGAFLEALFFSFAVMRLLKKQLAKGVSEKTGGRLIFGAVTAACAFALAVYAAIPTGIMTIAAKDMQVYLTQGLLFLGTGDMVEADRAYRQASEHFSAWKAVASGGGYSVPAEFTDDEVLLYMSKLGESTDTIRKFLAVNYDESTADMYLPLMLSRYKAADDLSEDELAHRKECLSLCVANEIFTADYPTTEDIEKKSGDILAMIGSDPDKQYAHYKTLANVLAGFETTETSFSSGISELIELAGENPDDLSIQYMTATLGSANVWDGAGHLDGTSECIMRFRSIWFKEYGEDADSEQIEAIELMCANMLMNIKKYDAAEKQIQDALAGSPDSYELKQCLVNCYLELDKTDKCYELAKEMYAEKPDDVMTLWLYSVGALKNGSNEEAIKIAGELADVVENDEGEPELDGDALLFTCATYFALDDSERYTDYQYRIYDGEDTEPKLLEQFKKNDFFYNYVNAIYWTKQKYEPEKALPYAQKALSYQEKCGRLWYLNGMVHYSMKNYEEAAKAYEEANRLVPNDASTLFALASSYDALGRYEEALELCEEIDELYPNGIEHFIDLYGVSAHYGALYNALKNRVNGG